MNIYVHIIGWFMLVKKMLVKSAFLSLFVFFFGLWVLLVCSKCEGFEKKKIQFREGLVLDFYYY
jgi:hypothetical protein